MQSLDVAFLSVLIALLFDAVIGWPAALFQRIGHPVTWIGALIAWLDSHLNKATLSFSRRRYYGVISLIILIALVGGSAAVLQITLIVFLPKWLAIILLGVLMATLVAQKSLYQHVASVVTAMQKDGLLGGRRAVAMIVGRDPETLDDAGVGRATIESLAENFSDAVVAPVFWALVGGLPGIAMYKAINTADSMIGHLSSHYKAFGWASARLDDLVNLPGSRLAALLLALAALVTGRAARQATQAVLRDASKHRSPNAGWPEAAMAGALGLAIGGPRSYAGVPIEDAWMGNGRSQVQLTDIRAALSLYSTACLLQGGLLALCAVAVWF